MFDVALFDLVTLTLKFDLDTSANILLDLYANLYVFFSVQFSSVTTQGEQKCIESVHSRDTLKIWSVLLMHTSQLVGVVKGVL